MLNYGRLLVLKSVILEFKGKEGLSPQQAALLYLKDIVQIRDIKNFDE